MNSLDLKKRLLSTVLCGGVLAFGLGLPALAQAGQMLKPTSNWAVSEIASVRMGGDAYCALARRFTDDMVLTMARNGNDESSFAIDFQKEALTRNQSYAVILRPSAGQERSFDVRPVSGRAMVVRLGKDYAFYDALNRSGSMDVDIAGQVYSFDMTDFRDGQDRLNGCLTTMREAAAAKAATEASEAAPVESVETQPVEQAIEQPVATSESEASAPVVQDVTEIEMMRREVTSLRMENDQLRQDFDTQGQNLSDSKTGVTALVTELNSRIRSLEKQNEDLRLKLQSGTEIATAAESCPAPDTSTADDMARELQALRDENAVLKQKLKTADEQLAQALRQGGDRDTAAMVADLKMRVGTLEAENKGLKKSLETAASENGQFQARIAILEAENDNLKKSLGVAMSDGSQTQTRSAILETQNEELRRSLESAMASSSEIKARITALESENNDLRASLNTAVSTSSEAQAKVAALESSNAEMRRLMGASAETDRSAQGRIASLEAQTTDLKVALSSAQAGNNDLKVRITALESENTGLRMAMENSPNSDGGVMLRVQALEKENAGLRVALSKAATGASTGAAEDDARVAALEAENKALKTSLDEAAANDDQVQVWVSTLENENAELKKSLETAQAGGAVADARMSGLEAENKSLKQADKNLSKGVFGESEGASGALEARVAALEAENLALRESAAASQDIDNKTRDRIAALEAENENLKKATEQKPDGDAEKDQAQEKADNARIVALEAEKAELQKALDAARSDQTMKNQIDALNQENESLKAAVADARAKAQATPVSVPQADPALEAKVAALEAEKASLNRALAEAHDDGKFKARVAALEAENDELRASLDKALSAQSAPRGAETSSAVDWNLEQATSRYNEAERELRRMGSQLEQQRAQCASEKKQVERMLFDPAIATKEQTARLVSLEQALADKDSELRNVRNRLAAYEGRSGNGEYASDVTPPSAAVPSPAPVQHDDVSSYRSGSVQQSTTPTTRDLPPVTGRKGFMSAGAMQSFLQQAGLSLQGGVSALADSGAAGIAAFTWESQGIYGTAEQQAMDAPGGFDAMVSQYLDKTRSRCEGDFAAVPGIVQQGSVRASSYEIACIGAGGNASASLIFFGREGVFTTIAHEAGVDQMDAAMDIRDRIMAALAQMKMASN